MAMTLTKWLKTATTEQAERLATLADTSVKTLRHITAGRRSGSADTAIRIAEASVQVDGSPGEISQPSVCPACRRCQHYKTTPQ